MKKRLLFFAGLIAIISFFCLLILEIFLRVEGAVYNWRIAKTEEYSLKSSPSAFRISCIGDSHTMGQGSTNGNDYPLALQRILNKRSKNRRYVVSNQGRGGVNSSECVNKIKQIVEKSPPELLIVMIGSIDRWSHTGLNPAVFDEKGFSLPLIIDASLSRLKIYKLLKVFINKDQLAGEKNNDILFLGGGKDSMDANMPVKRNAEILSPEFQDIPVSNIENNGEADEVTALLRQAEECQRAGRVEEAMQIFKQTSSLRPFSEAIYYELIEFCYNQRMIEEAIKYCKELLKVNPRLDWAYGKLAMIYREQNRYEEALDTCQEALKINPQNFSILTRLAFLCKDSGRYFEGLIYAKKAFVLSPDSNDCHGIMLWLYREAGKYDEEVEKFLRMNKSYAIIDEKTKFLFASQIKNLNEKEKIRKKFKIQDELTEKILSYNLESAIKIAQENNVKIILCGYPQYHFPSRIMEKNAKKYGIPFVNTKKFFKQNIKAKDRDGYFNPDKHCNDRGYYLVAESIYQTLLKLHLVEE